MIDMCHLKGANGLGVHAAEKPRVTLCGKKPFFFSFILSKREK